MIVDVPSDQQLIRTWESGRHLHPLDRALRILAATYPRATWDDLATLSLSRRNALLLRAYQCFAGNRLEGFCSCPKCGDEVEFVFDASELLTAADARSSSPTDEGNYCVACGDYVVHYRAPNSLDLALALQHLDAAGGRQELLRRSVVSAHRRCADESLETMHAEAVSAEALPAEVIGAVGDQLDLTEPLAAIGFAIDCPTCSLHWTAAFDVVSFVWEQIANRANRLLYEVHLLARAYGWSEGEILEMSTARRQSYLQWI